MLNMIQYRLFSYTPHGDIKHDGDTNFKGFVDSDGYRDQWKLLKIYKEQDLDIARKELKYLNDKLKLKTIYVWAELQIFENDKFIGLIT